MLRILEVEDTRTFMIQGEVTQPGVKCNESFRLCDSNIIMTASKGNLLVANPKNNKVLSYNVIFKAPKELISGNELDFQNTSDIANFLLNRFSDWHDCYKQLFRSTSSLLDCVLEKFLWTNPGKIIVPCP